MLLRACALLLAAALLLEAQAAPGTIVVGITVTATAGSVVCVFSNPARPAVHTVCTAPGMAQMSQDATPAVGAMAGVIGSFTVGVNSVTWAITQPLAGMVNWQLGANGTLQTGTF